MNDSFPVYTKPQVHLLEDVMTGWPRSAKVSRVIPEVAWTKFVAQRTVIEKTVMVEAPVSKVWELVGNPVNVPLFTPGVVGIEEIKKGVYQVTDTIPPQAGETWSTVTFEESIVKSVPEKEIDYRISRDGIQEDFVFLLQEEKDRTSLTLRFEGNFKLLNPTDVENDMDRILLEVARLAMDKQNLLSRIKEFEARRREK